MKKDSKGITLVSLVIVIVVMLIIAGITLNVSFDRFEINNLKKMLSDLELLEDKVNNYYLEYNELPIVRDSRDSAITYTIPENFEKNSGDNENYYIINLKALEKGVALNYGKDWSENPISSDDVYIINEQSHNIYYAKGIKMKGKYYYSFIDNTKIEDTIKPSKPEIKIISGVKNEAGKYTTEVKLEIIPGKDNWSGVSKTEYSINNESEWKVLSENNILTLSENGNYNIKVKTSDNKDNAITTELEITIEIEEETNMNVIE